MIDRCSRAADRFGRSLFPLATDIFFGWAIALSLGNGYILRVGDRSFPWQRIYFAGRRSHTQYSPVRDLVYVAREFIPWLPIGLMCAYWLV